MKKIVVYMFSFAILYSCNRKDNRNNENKSEENLSEYSQKAFRCRLKASDLDWYQTGQKAPKFSGLDGINFKISTSNGESQEYFNQGMMLSYGFNHAESARSFYEAARLDSSCAMCYWGYAYVLGPNYNAGMEIDNFERAYSASRKAIALLSNCTEKEKLLINALAVRYVQNPPEDRKHLDIAYSAAMKKVYEKYPGDADIGALYAESLMDLHPWDLYEKKTKQPKPWTPEILNILETLMIKNPKHPGAHHFYIHAVEASANPEKGLQSAKILPTLAPGSGHLLHMSSHIYINTGDYHKGSLANLEAVKVDNEYVNACNAQGAYPLAYFPHNYHFLAATATLEGNSSLAWMASKKVQENTSQEIMIEPGWGTLQHYYCIPYYVAVKFAFWDTILSIPEPAKNLIYPRAVLHYARGMAQLGKNNLPGAENELSMLQTLSVDSSLHELTIWGINSTYDLIQIATHVLSAEISKHKKDTDNSIKLLVEAVAMEDKLNYDEPPDWFFSVRHLLGKAYLETGEFTLAEETYKDDLKTFRENGWALIGLHQALLMQEKTEEAATIKDRFDNAWKYADIKISQSSF